MPAAASGPVPVLAARPPVSLPPAGWVPPAPPPLDEARKELAAVNTKLKKHGAPVATFGAVPQRVPVGLIVHGRPELCMLGVHRHLFSEATCTR